MWFALKVVAAVVVAVVLYVLAARVIRNFMVEPEPGPDPAALRPVDYRYRCGVCGAEVTMTAAPGDEEPQPPRHCREDMVLVGDAPDQRFDS